MGRVGPVVRPLVLFGCAMVGGQVGRLVNALRHGEPHDPLLRPSREWLLCADVVPAYLAAELAGKIRADWRTAACTALVVGAVVALADGPFVRGGAAGKRTPEYDRREPGAPPLGSPPESTRSDDGSDNCYGC